MKRIFLLVLLFSVPAMAFALDIDTDSNNATDIANGGTNATTTSAARTNLGLGTAAITDTGTSDGDVLILTGACDCSGAGDVPACESPENLNQGDCETDGGTWVGAISNMIDDASDGENSIISASEVNARIAAGTWSYTMQASDPSIGDMSENEWIYNTTSKKWFVRLSDRMLDSPAWGETLETFTFTIERSYTAGDYITSSDVDLSTPLDCGAVGDGHDSCSATVDTGSIITGITAIGNWGSWDGAVITGGQTTGEATITSDVTGSATWTSETYAYVETFESVGYDLSWTEPYPDPDEDFSSVGLDMEGSKVLGFGSGSSRLNITASGEVYVTAKVRTELTTGVIKYLISFAIDTANTCRLALASGQTFKIYDGSTWSSATTETLPINTSKYVRFRYKPATSSGANDGECGVAVWTGSAWGIEKGTTTMVEHNDVNNVTIDGDATPMYFDTIKVKIDGEITNPLP